MFDAVLDAIFNSNQQMIDRFWGIFFAVAMVTFSVVFYYLDRKSRRPQGLAKLLAILSFLTFATLMPGFALACGFGEYGLAMILFLAALVIFAILSIISKISSSKSQKKQKH